MEELIFKVEGVNKKQRTLLMGLSVFSLIGGIIAFIVSQIKEKGYFIERYVFDKDERQTIIIIGVIAIVIAATCFDGWLYQNKSYIALYENHIECLIYFPVLFFVLKKPLNTSYDKIKDVQFSKAEGFVFTDTIFIITETQKLGAQVNGAEQAYQIIKQKTEAKIAKTV